MHRSSRRLGRRGWRTVAPFAVLAATLVLGVASAGGVASPAIPSISSSSTAIPTRKRQPVSIGTRSSRTARTRARGRRKARSTRSSRPTSSAQFDDQFATGSKDISPISGWEWKKAEPGDKVDIQNAFAATYDKDGDQLIYFGADRHANNGDAEIGFWFFRDTIQAVDDGTPPNLPFTGQHQIGDVFVEAQFTQGGETTTVQVYEWVGSAVPTARST